MKYALLTIGCLLSGCFAGGGTQYDNGTPIPSPSGDIISVFPHPANWAQPQQHGVTLKTVFNFDTTACQQCHGADLEGQSGPSCYECHINYPHRADWGQREQHGAMFQTAGRAACATACHGTDLRGGLSGISCTACHSIWPHTTDWNETHGESARATGVATCTSCHRNDATGGTTGINCISCHPSLLEHAQPEWDSIGHATYAAPDRPDTLTECRLCHGDQLEGESPNDPTLTPVPSCAGCHPSYPERHAASDWPEFTGHGDWLMAQSPLTLDECRLCHGDTLTGQRTNPSCYGCHTSFPHPVPAAIAGGDFSPWSTKHGQYFAAETSAQSSCATANCHGIDLTGNPPNVPVAEKRVKGCGDCHIQIPHRSLAEWDHGRAALTDDDLFDPTACTQCHGATLEGGAASPSCSSVDCHDHYPQPHRTANWARNLDWTAAGGHGTTIWEAAPTSTVGWNAATQAGCTTCHGDAFGGGSAGASCFTCHPSYPHPIDGSWLGDAGHGAQLQQRALATGQSLRTLVADECQSCHSQIGGMTPACTDCHDPNAVYPHPAGWHDTDDPFGGTHGDSVAVSGPAAAGCLTACHGTDGSNGFIEATYACTQCHATYPHVAAEWTSAEGTAYAGHAAAVIDTNTTPTRDDDTLQTEQFAQCTGCHGGLEDFDADVYELPQAVQYVMKNGQPHLPRCYACHHYPHRGVSLTLWGTLTTWAWGTQEGTDYTYAYGHIPAITHWAKTAALSRPALVAQACTTVNGMAGCHSDGPVQMSQPSTKPECQVCHAVDTDPEENFDHTGYGALCLGCHQLH